MSQLKSGFLVKVDLSIYLDENLLCDNIFGIRKCWFIRFYNIQIFSIEFFK